MSTKMSTPEMSTPEMSTIFKKPTTLPVVINFKHSVSKSRDYAGCPRIVASCENFDFNSSQVGYGYDLIAALMSDFINSECTQYAIQCVYAFNELRGGYNFIHALNSGKFYVNAGCLDDIVYFLDDIGLSVTFNCKKNGEITSAVIYK